MSTEPGTTPASSPCRPPRPTRPASTAACWAAPWAIRWATPSNSTTSPRSARRFGPAGLQDFAALDGGSHFSDDTQLTLYTVDGLVEALEWANSGSARTPTPACGSPTCAGSAPRACRCRRRRPVQPPRWIDAHEVLKHRRAPGNACLSGLATGEMGTVYRPVNPGLQGLRHGDALGPVRPGPPTSRPTSVYKLSAGRGLADPRPPRGPAERRRLQPADPLPWPPATACARPPARARHRLRGRPAQGRGTRSGPGRTAGGGPRRPRPRTPAPAARPGGTGPGTRRRLGGRGGTRRRALRGAGHGTGHGGGRPRPAGGPLPGGDRARGEPQRRQRLHRVDRGQHPGHVLRRGLPAGGVARGARSPGGHPRHGVAAGGCGA